jgi:hypothetical protein
MYGRLQLFFNGTPADMTDVSGAPFLAASDMILERNAIHAFLPQET